MFNNHSHAIFEYLRDTLGVQYIPRSAPSVAEAHSPIVWQHPHFTPTTIFFNQDASTDLSDSQTRDLFQKIVQAMGLDLNKIWYVDHHNRSFMDFLNWLKSQNLTSPIVVMKKDPDIQNSIQNAGAFDWVECFSLQQMKEKTNLKKPTWEVLKILMEKK